MITIPRFRAEVTGHFVQFFSRDPQIKTVRWHSRFKAEYHTLRDAKAEKTQYEATGKILGPDDLRPKESQPNKPAQAAASPAAGTPDQQRIMTKKSRELVGDEAT
jgi:hypothetical protein